MKMRRCLIVLALAAAVLGCDRVAPIVEGGRSDWKIVPGSAERDKLAATDFQEIFEKATGVKLALEVKSKSEKGKSEEGKSFLVGAESLGAEASRLADEQTCVIAKDGNVVVRGRISPKCASVWTECPLQRCISEKCTHGSCVTISNFAGPLK